MLAHIAQRTSYQDPHWSHVNRLYQGLKGGIAFTF